MMEWAMTMAKLYGPPPGYEGASAGVCGECCDTAVDGGGGSGDGSSCLMMMNEKSITVD